jgi:hypothetical protein
METMTTLTILEPHKPDRGNSKDYLIRRLKRDHPDIAEALGRGEYKSARAAAIEAGIIRKPARLKQTQQLVEKISIPEIEDLLEFILDEIKRRTGWTPPEPEPEPEPKKRRVVYGPKVRARKPRVKREYHAAPGW